MTLHRLVATATLRLLVAAFIVLIPSGAVTSGGLVILHTNDMHGRIVPEKSGDSGVLTGGAARLAFAMEVERRKARMAGYEVLTVDSGDFFQGTPYSDLSMGLDMLPLARLMGYEAMALGNHEFDFGQEGLEKITCGAGFPFVCVNLVRKDGSSLACVVPWTIIEKTGLKVGLVGAMTPDLPQITGARNIEGLIFKDLVPSVLQAAGKCREAGADVVVLLSHLGWEQDKALAAKLGGTVDVIVGSHTHTPARHAVRQGGPNTPLVAQAGSYCAFLGRVTIETNESGKPIGSTGLLIPIVSGRLGEMPAVAALVAGMDKVVEARLGMSAGTLGEEVLSAIPSEIANTASRSSGTLERMLGGKILTTVLPGGSVIALETGAGNLVADSIRASCGAQGAIQNGGGVRAGLDSGQVTLKDIYRVMPFDNEVVLTEVDGKTLFSLAERAVARFDYGVAAFSGIEVVFDPSAEPLKRVRSVKINGADLDPAALYRIATNRFIFAGGDGYVEFEGSTEIPAAEPIGVREAMARYIGSNPGLIVRPEGRLRVLNR